MSTYLSSISSRSLAPRSTAPTVICALCRRSLSSSLLLRSGHNRWSKIRHKKGAADAKKNTQNSNFSKNLTLYSKLFGSDPRLNSRLATVIAVAKKAGMPKANIDIAIARGQGKSSSGAGLESLTVEIMMPSSVAMVVEVETENKLRALQDLRGIIRKCGGTITPIAYLFTRLGRIVLKGKSDDDFDGIMMQALEAGAEDVEQDENGDVVLWTQPNTTHQVAQAMSEAISAEILDSDIIWSPVADKVKLDRSTAAASINSLLAALRNESDVQAIYANVERGTVSEELWETIEDNLDM
ncbi:YebC-like protein [Annulohypoxylon maeteangense]|uniref:YebC-like protein n=1 Tax=Annulohypoxylon maeteangense TaxID=1927788 RepID=UPI0020076976|nr:YebC-like protein [Annulohypoxylon maeteangense]KAI0880830.1 YebC-like protein [Annulohypoxylon maeteangense]